MQDIGGNFRHISLMAVKALKHLNKLCVIFLPVLVLDIFWIVCCSSERSEILYQTQIPAKL